MELRGDGRGRYHGYGYVLIDRAHQFRLRPDDLRCLVEDFRAADFWSLATHYRAPITDNSTFIVTLEIGGQRKSVVDYVGRAVGMPAAVTALEAAIDHVGADRWVTGDADTVPSLEEEHFDFHAPASGTLVANAAARAPDALVLALLAHGAPATGRVALRMQSPPNSGPTVNDGPTAVETASGRGRLTVVRALIDAGAFSTGEPGIKEAALRAAAASGDTATVLELLSRHPDVDAPGPAGETALTHAAGTDNPGAVAAILQFKPNVNARTQDGVTALMAVTRSSHDKAPSDLPARQADVVRLLLAAGADARLRDGDGATALFYTESAEAVRMLVKAGADLEAHDALGDTPLTAAASDEAAMALIEAGANLRVANDEKKTILDRARSAGWNRTLAYLGEHGQSR